MTRARPSRAAQVSLNLGTTSPLALANRPKRKKKRAPKPLAEPKPLYRVPKLPLPILGMDPSLTHSAGHFAEMHTKGFYERGMGRMYPTMGPGSSAPAIGGILRDEPDFVVHRMLSRFSIQTDADTYSHRLHRLNGMRSAFLHELDRVTRAYGPGLMVVEGYPYGIHTGKVFERAEWGGQLRMSAYSMGWDVLEVGPTMLKRWTAEAGNARKVDMMDAVEKRFRYKCTDDNDADAFALSQLGGAFIRWRLGATVTSEEAEQFARLEVWEAKHGR